MQAAHCPDTFLAYHIHVVKTQEALTPQKQVISLWTEEKEYARH